MRLFSGDILLSCNILYSYSCRKHIGFVELVSAEDKRLLFIKLNKLPESLLHHLRWSSFMT